MKQTTLKEPPVSDALCLSCRKCCAGCPAGIDIPGALEIYGRWRSGCIEVLHRFESAQSGGQPVDCIECGACTACCPHGREPEKIVRRLAMLQACRKSSL